MSSPRLPPRFVPTLTEVVEFGDALVVSDGPDVMLEPAAGPTPVAWTGEPAAPLVEQAEPTEPALHLSAEASALTDALPAPAAVVVSDVANDMAHEAAPDHHPPAAVSTEDVPAFLLATPGFGGAAPAAPAPSRLPDTATSVAPSAQPVTEVSSGIDAGQEEQIVHNVLAELQRRTDLMLEYRLREALNPILARLCDTLIKEAREDLAATLRDVVARAVAQEIGRHRPK